MKTQKINQIIEKNESLQTDQNNEIEEEIMRKISKVEEKRQHEKEIISQMIDIYCQGKAHTKPCDECQDLTEYALLRIEQCPQMATKSYCSVCETQCYSPRHREKIREVMRYSGKQYFLVHPVITIKHGWVTLKARRQQIKNKSNEKQKQ